MLIARPLFTTVWIRFHSAGKTAAAVAATIGGAVAEQLQAGAIRDCGTLRLSHALLVAGLPIPQGTHRTLTGADGRAYFHRASDIAQFLQQRLGAPDAMAAAGSDAAWSSSKGIVVLHSALSHQGGSVTLWNGRQAADPIALAGAHHSKIWVLP